MTHRVHLCEQVTACLLTVIGDAPGNDPFDLEARGIRIATRGKRLEGWAEEAFLREAALGLGQDNVGRDQPVVVGAFEVLEHRSNTGVGQALPAGMTGLHQVGGGFVAIDAVGHAANE